jgi:uncharacterized membrane protein
VQDVASAAVLLGVALATARIYSRLPNAVPTHFDLHGEVDGTMPRFVAAVFGPAVATSLYLLLRFLLPRATSSAGARGALQLMAPVMGGFVLIMHVCIMHGALTGRFSFAVLAAALGALSLALGLVLPRVRQNPFVGVRTFWTLQSNATWARTHHFAGYAYAFAGALGIVGALFAERTAATMIATAALLTASLASVFFSWVVYQPERKAP